MCPAIVATARAVSHLGPALCVRVRQRESERASERESARERERERERETERVGARAAALPQPLHMQGVGYRAYSDTA